MQVVDVKGKVKMQINLKAMSYYCGVEVSVGGGSYRDVSLSGKEKELQGCSFF